VILSVRVTPRAAREGVAGVAEGVLRVRLTAPPVEGRANEALVAFLAKAAGVPRASVAIVAGDRGRNKTVRIEGVGRGALSERLGVELP
jgi:uncharacterized protein (TIGR00251 family)